MKLVQTLWFFPFFLMLSACQISPEQQAAREAKRIRAEQAFQVKLARQCDYEAAELMEQQFNPPLSQSENQRKAFEKRYTEKIANPVFQACYRMALEHYKAQQEIEQMRLHYDEDFRFGFGRYCYFC